LSSHYGVNNTNIISVCDQTQLIFIYYTELHVSTYLTFGGPCIVIYSYNKSQRDALLLNFILVKDSTCFGQTYCRCVLSSG